MSTVAEAPSPTDPPDSAETVAANPTKPELLPSPGTVWRHNFNIIEGLPDQGGARWWRANRVANGEEILLCATTPLKTEARSAAWKHLRALDLSHLQRAYEEFSVGPHRIEVYGVISGRPLDEWRRARATLDFATIEAIVRQLAEAIGVLQASGLVHFGLRPGAVFIDEVQGQFHCTVAAMETVALFNHSQLIAATADPLFAPPEAVSLHFHEPCPLLCAWDWWSLGRIVQELILGHPVIDDLPGGHPDETAEQKRARAETLLIESSAEAPRAGAVEVMPPLEPRAELLLRGLLASSPEVRWRMEAMDSWIRQLPVKEHYNTRRIETKFRWRGRLYSIPDAAKALQSEEHWREAVPQLFEVETPGTLAHFIGQSANYKNTTLQVKEALALTEREPLQALPPALAREVAANLALLILSGKNLTWRGNRFEGDSLTALLAEAPDSPEQLALVRSFIHRTITGYIDRFNQVAGRSFIQVARYAADAETAIRQYGWIDSADEAAVEKILRLTIEPTAALLAIRERMQGTFACSTHPAFESSFKAVKPTRVELVVLAWIEPDATAHGFLTHAQWEAQQLEHLHEQSRPFTRGLFWAQQVAARDAGVVVFGPLPVVLITWSVAGAILAVVAGLAWAWVPGLLALGLRTIYAQTAANELRRFSAESKPWKWTDGVARGKAELAAAAQGLDMRGYEQALNKIDFEIAGFKRLSPPPGPIDRPHTFASTRMAAAASWVLLVGVVVASAWQSYVSPPRFSRTQNFMVYPVTAEPSA